MGIKIEQDLISERSAIDIYKSGNVTTIEVAGQELFLDEQELKDFTKKFIEFRIALRTLRCSTPS